MLSALYVVTSFISSYAHISLWVRLPADLDQLSRSCETTPPSLSLSFEACALSLRNISIRTGFVCFSLFFASFPLLFLWLFFSQSLVGECRRMRRMVTSGRLVRSRKFFSWRRDVLQVRSNSFDGNHQEAKPLLPFCGGSTFQWMKRRETWLAVCGNNTHTTQGRDATT